MGKGHRIKRDSARAACGARSFSSPKGREICQVNVALAQVPDSQCSQTFAIQKSMVSGISLTLPTTSLLTVILSVVLKAIG